MAQPRWFRRIQPLWQRFSNWLAKRVGLLRGRCLSRGYSGTRPDVVEAYMGTAHA